MGGSGGVVEGRRKWVATIDEEEYDKAEQDELRSQQECAAVWKKRGTKLTTAQRREGEERCHRAVHTQDETQLTAAAGSAPERPADTRRGT